MCPAHFNPALKRDRFRNGHALAQKGAFPDVWDGQKAA